MSSVLCSTIARLRRGAVVTPQRVFEAGRAQEAVLAEYPDVAAVLGTLAEDAPETYPRREALTRALLLQHRAGRQRLWASMLLVAFFPMLSRLRRRLFSDTIPNRELDQIVIAAFLAATREVPLDSGVDRLALRLRQRTERRVFACLRQERRQALAPQDAEALSEVEDEEEEAWTPEAPALEEEQLDLALLLERAAEEGVPMASLEMVAATVLRREPLRSYVERVARDDEVERERAYQRLKRKRSRLLVRLKKLAGPVSPEPLVVGLCKGHGEVEEAPGWPADEEGGGLALAA